LQISPLKTLVIGLDYERAPLSVREKLAISPEIIQESLVECYSLEGVEEVMILSTCNRTEIYAHCKDEDVIVGWLADYAGLDKDKLRQYLYLHVELQVIEHLFRLVSGLESMVLGETQIFGQIKNAYQSGLQAKVIGENLIRLFQCSFSVGKDVRSHTEIGSHAVSIGAAALKVAERIFSDVTRRSVLFVGAGEMIQLCKEHFSGRGIDNLNFTNRTLERAGALAESVNGNFFPLQYLPERLSQFDVIVSCTSSPLPIIGHGALAVAIRMRKHNPMVLVDLAVPRDIESTVAEMDDIFLFSIDDLEDVVRSNLEIRKSAIMAAEEIIRRGILQLRDQINRKELVPLLRSFRDYGEGLRESEMRKALDSLAKGRDPANVIEALAKGLTNKFLHRPSRVLGTAEFKEAEYLAAALAKLHDLDNHR
jgi:glutamyl-tRNA reductase